MTTTIWTLLFVFVIAPLGALAFDRSLFGNWIWHIAPEKVRDYEEHSGVTGKTPHQVARAGSLRGITDADMADMMFPMLWRCRGRPSVVGYSMAVFPLSD